MMRPLLFAVAMLMALCAVVHAQSQDEPPDAVSQLALSAAADQLGVAPDNLVIVESAQRDWPDSSLGCPVPGRAYAQIVTPGWMVYVNTSDLATEVQVHTDG